MKPSALFEALHALIGQRVPLHIWGACGVGKSQIVAQVASDLNWQFLDVRASSSTRSICEACRESLPIRRSGCHPSFCPRAEKASSFSTS
jgi:replication-associated recombination protein RarA